MAAVNTHTENSGAGPSSPDEFTFPIISQPGSHEAHYDEKGLHIFPPSPALWGTNLQTNNVVGAGSDEEAHFKGKGPVTFVAPSAALAPIREESQGDSERTQQPFGNTENTDHTITYPDRDHICRTCDPDEECTDTDNLLVELGCRSTGTLSRMHRKCILEWFGPRMCLKHDYSCELCNAVLHDRIKRIVGRAMFNLDSGRDILVIAKATGFAPHARRNADPNIQINIEIARGIARQAPNQAPNRMQRQRSITDYAPTEWAVWPLFLIMLVMVGVIYGIIYILRPALED